MRRLFSIAAGRDDIGGTISQREIGVGGGGRRRAASQSAWVRPKRSRIERMSSAERAHTSAVDLQGVAGSYLSGVVGP